MSKAWAAARRFRLKLSMVSLAVLCAAMTQPSMAEEIWIEGEDATRHSMQRHGWYDDVDRDNLSGGDWLSHFAAGDAPRAEYAFDVKGAGDFHFWIRCNTVATPRLDYRLDRGAWRSIDTSQPLQVTNIASDGKPDMRFVAWVHAGQLRLKPDSHTIEFRFQSENNNHGAIDCFLLCTTPFRPRGALRPGERSGNANSGFFAWEPGVDVFSPNALIDLTYLNEEVAGQQGRVRSEGNRFVLGDGQPVKFWAVNAGPGIWQLDPESQVYLAKRLAKSGVNMVRLHGAIYGARDPKVDRHKLDHLHRMVHALKTEGIYVSLSFYFPLWFQLDDDRHPFMLLFFDPEMQKIYRGWASELLTTNNPYTGIPLSRDPSVSMVEIVNEDSHFFWTFKKDNMPAHRWRYFTQQYGDWLRKKYGTLPKAVEAWGGITEAGDDLAKGRVELYGAWDMTSDGVGSNDAKVARLSDQVRFLTENMRGFYRDTIAYFREQCSYDGLISCGNWHVADASTLDALERYCYTAGDVIDHHGYFDSGHSGDASSYSVRPGQEFTSQSALHLHHHNPLPFVETNGHPHIVSEIGWPAPNMYRAEFPFVASAYGSLSGLDGIFSFALGSAGWDQEMKKFPINTPATLGCFPAAALVYRRGDVKEGPIVIRDNIQIEDLYSLKGSPVHAHASLDQLRAAAIPAGQTRDGAVKSIDPLAFYVGRVAREFGGSPKGLTQASLAKYIDRKRERVSSATGELMLNYDRGAVTMNTPRAQGAAGFLRDAGAINLENVTIKMQNDYGTVTVVALDDAPIATSEKILIQAMTIEQPYGFRASGKNNLSGTIESVGSAPFGVEKYQVTVTLKLAGSAPTSVVACDEHGYPKFTAVEASGDAHKARIVLDPESPYHVVLRQPPAR